MSEWPAANSQNHIQARPRRRQLYDQVYACIAWLSKWLRKSRRRGAEGMALLTLLLTSELRAVAAGGKERVDRGGY
jgi:hypothetical protein